MKKEFFVRDYVCLMNVKQGIFDFEYQSRNFSFCSQQCRDRFESNPHLYIGYAGKPAAKQRGEHIIKHLVLKLDQAIPEQEISHIKTSLKAMMGILDVIITNNKITLTYDLLQATAQQIESMIEQCGEVLGKAWSDKFKRAIVHYHEETLLSNLEYDTSHTGYHQHK